MTRSVRKRQLKKGATSDKRPAPPRRMRQLLARLARRLAASVVKMQEKSVEKRQGANTLLPLVNKRAEAENVSTPPQRVQHASEWSPDAQAFASPYDPSDAAMWHMRVLRPALQIQEVGVQCSSPFVVRAVDWPSLVHWLVDRHWDYELKTSTLFLAMYLASRFFARRHVPSHRLYLLGATALILASKFEEEAAPGAQALSEESTGQFRDEEVHLMEIAVLQFFEFKIHVPTAAHYLDWVHIDWFTSLGAGNYWQRQLAQYVAELGFASPHYISWAPSQHAAAAVVLSHVLLEPSRGWLRALLEQQAGGKSAERVAIRDAVYELLRVMRSTIPSSAVYQKFADEQHGNLAGAAAQLVNSVTDQHLDL